MKITTSNRLIRHLCIRLATLGALTLGTAGPLFSQSWDNGTGNSAKEISDKNNWVNNTLPTLTGGGSTLTFGTDGSNVLINTNVDVFKIIINRNAAFSIQNAGGTLTIRGGGIEVTSAYTHNISVNSLILGADQPWWVGTGATLNVSSVISGAFGITKQGTGKVILANANSYTGTTAVSEGTLEYGVNNAISTGAVSIDGSSAILNLGAFTDTVGTVTVANGGSITGSGTLASTGSFEMKSGSVSAILAGSGIALNKTTAGTVTLSGANTYSGSTSVNQGTLVVSGSIGNSAVIVNNSGTVLASGVTGTIGNSVTVNSGAILAPGGLGGIGTASVGSGGLNMTPGSIFSWDVSSAGTYDKVTAAVTGSSSIFSVVLASGQSFTDTFWNTDRTWSDVFSSGSLSNVFSSISGTNISWDNTLKRGNVANQGYFAFTGGTNVQWTAIPEPTSALAGLLIAAGLLRRRRNAVA